MPKDGCSSAGDLQKASALGGPHQGRGGEAALYQMRDERGFKIEVGRRPHGGVAQEVDAAFRLQPVVGVDRAVGNASGLAQRAQAKGAGNGGQLLRAQLRVERHRGSQRNSAGSIGRYLPLMNFQSSRSFSRFGSIN